MTGTKYMNLQWNDFQDNAKSLFQSLRNDSSFTDVTLACNGIQIEVHKVILCGSSPFFTSILKAKPSHPLIYLRGIKAENLVSIVDFIYNGQVNVLEENLNEFLDVAKEDNGSSLDRCVRVVQLSLILQLTRIASNSLIA